MRTKGGTTMENKEEVKRLFDLIDEQTREHIELNDDFEPLTFRFNDNTKEIFDELKKELEANNFTLFDLNEYLEIKPEDYNISVVDAGFKDDSGKLIKDVALISDDEKRNLIISAKFNQLDNIITGNKNVVFIVTYDDTFEPRTLKYKKIRTLLKDGHHYYGYSIIALVYCKTKEHIMDFLPYGLNMFG